MITPPTDDPAPPGGATPQMPLLVAGAARIGIHLTDGQLAQFALYRDELLAWTNSRANLTAITDPIEIERLLFLESLAITLESAFHDDPLQADGDPAPTEGEQSGDTESRYPTPPPLSLSTLPPRVIDVGAGGGFPGIPLKIAFPDMELTLVESTRKKVDFLEHVVRALGLEGVIPIHARAEDVARNPTHREQYDIATARGLAPMPVLAELCLPFVRVGGVVVAAKGADADRETSDAEHAIRLLGGAIEGSVRVAEALPDLPDEHRLVIINKMGPTPSTYPRRAGTPSKRPL